ncbi:MAG TPA: hypothetical protein VJP89_12870, partial [Pyrinomonadaceae bacterium]|nr:hypothetical protein [Pyrinomonadaceae bacterium]
MQPAEKKPEVVYRRRAADRYSPPTESAVVADLARRAFVRAITPLIIGFLLLLGLIVALGLRSANKMESVAFNARDLAFQYSAQLTLLQDLRLMVTKL